MQGEPAFWELWHLLQTQFADDKMKSNAYHCAPLFKVVPFDRNNQLTTNNTNK